MVTYSISKTNADIGETITLSRSENIQQVTFTYWIIDLQPSDYSFALGTLLSNSKCLLNIGKVFANHSELSTTVTIEDNHTIAHTLTPITVASPTTQYLTTMYTTSINELQGSSIFTVDIGEPIEVNFNRNIYNQLKFLVNRWTKGKEDKSNKVTSISSSSTDTQYPSAKCVYDELTLKVNDKTRATTTFSPQDYEDENSSQCTWDNSYRVTIGSNGYLILDFTSMLEEIDDRVYFNIVTDNTINVDYNGTAIYSSSDAKSLYIQKKASDVFELYLFNNGEFTSLQNIYTKTTPILQITPTTTNSTTINFGNKMWYHYMHFIDRVYPVGSIYISTNSVNPQYIIGGEWEQIQDRFLLASGSTYSAGTTGGEATHTLTTNEMPSHTHTQNAHSHTIGSLARYVVSGNGNAAVGNGYGNTQDYGTSSTTATNKNTGGGQAHNNMPPYLGVYMWKRIG